MNDQEAFDEFIESREDFDTEEDVAVAQITWNAALAWLRSQGEQIGEMSQDANGEWSLHWSRAVPYGAKLYIAPQPAIPDGWKLVPVEPTGDMWSAGVSAFIAKAQRYEMAKTAGESCAIVDTAPGVIYSAMLAAAPEPRK